MSWRTSWRRDPELATCARAAARGHFASMDELAACYGGGRSGGGGVGVTAARRPLPESGGRAPRTLVLLRGCTPPQPDDDELYAAYVAATGDEPEPEEEPEPEIVEVPRDEYDDLVARARWADPYELWKELSP